MVRAGDGWEFWDQGKGGGFRAEFSDTLLQNNRVIGWWAVACVYIPFENVKLSAGRIGNVSKIASFVSFGYRPDC